MTYILLRSKLPLLLLLLITGIIPARLGAQMTCGFVLSDTVSCAPFLIEATANETTPVGVFERRWTITGPGVNQTSPLGVNLNFQYIANNPGNYCLKLWSRNLNGDTCVVTKCNITVAENPTVNFTFTSVEGCSPLDVEAFCNSTAGSGVIDTLKIEWGCGGAPYIGIGCPSTPIPKTYTGLPGCCSPTVIVRNSFGCYADFTYTNQVCIIPKPVADFTADTPVVNCATGPQTVNFTATNAGANMIYSWYVNGAMVQSGASNLLTHTFAVDPVCYDVALKVQHPSSSACSDSVFKAGYVCVRAQPSISFTASASNVCVVPGSSGTVVLTSTSPGNPNMVWNLSGGSPVQNFPPQTGNTATYTVSNFGNYTVTVTGTFGPGCSATITQQAFVVNQKPVAAFTVLDAFGCSTPFTTTFNATTCTGCSYQWAFQGGSNITGITSPTTSVTYNNYTNGSNVILTVTATNGCTDVRQDVGLIKIREINPRIYSSRKQGCGPLCVTFDDVTPYINIPDTIASVCWSFPGSATPGACQDTVKRCFTQPGCYDVVLKVTTTTGCVDSLYWNDSICVGAPPVCNVTACAGSNCTTPAGPPLTMCFEEDTVIFTLACDSFDYAKVDYGDGIVEVVTAQAFQHFYQDTGMLTTTIIPYSDSCSFDTLRVKINILPPVATFHDSTTCASGDTVFLVNDSKGASSYKWYFCNGDSSSVFNPVVLLPPCDTCQIQLVASNVNGCVHQKTLDIISPCQGVSFTPMDTVVCVPITLQFQNTSSSFVPGSTLWDFNIGTVNFPGGANSTGDIVNRVFNNTGVFTIAMRNVSQNGCVDTLFSTVTACRITANFSPTSVCLPLPANFKDLSVDTVCGVSSWAWSFGDGTFSSDPNPVHTYANPGQYTVSLTVTNSAGCSATSTKTVNAAPVNISYTIDTIICPGKQGCVVNNSTGASLTYSWTINGALPQSNFTTAAPCYSFAAPGDYPAYIQISSAGQCDFFDTVVIHNQFPQVGGYVSDNYIACPNPPQILQFYDTSKYVDSTWLWDFGDASQSVFDTSTHIYNTPGCYGVYLTGTTKDGCSNTVFVDSVCVDGPYGEFGFSPLGMCACKDTIIFTVSTVNSYTLSLVYGCLQGNANVNPITPIGTVGNPTILNFPVPYCVTDSCQPQLIFGDTAGCQVYVEGNLAYIDSPVVNFTFNNYGVCVNGTVCFQDATTYTLPPAISYTVKRVWDFGDGTIDSTSNNPAPCHYYGQPGGYNTKLYITSNYGCYDSIISLVVVVPEFPIAGFYADDSLVCAESPICFHDTSWIYPLTGADYWVVDFGDGSVDTFYTEDFCHAYDTGGYYRVTMCVYDSVGCPDCDSSVVIRVIDNPVANAGGDRNVCYGVVTQLNGTGGSIPRWEPAGLFSDPDSYTPTVQLFNDTTVTFYVGNQYGCQDTDYAVLSISRVFADFTIGTTFCEKVPVCVTDASTNMNGTLVSWRYDFGDGVSQSGPDTCHSYAAFGTIPVELLVTDNNGCVDSITKTVDILPSPVAAFSLNDTVICSDQLLCVTDLTTSNTAITSWQWNYGTVFTTSVQNPACYLFSPPYQPSYDLSLVVVDQNTCRDTAFITAVLNQVPSANFTWSTSCESEPMPLSNTSTQGDGAIVGCEWLLWVGAPSPVIDNNCNASFQFPAGSYPVQLVVADINGCTDTIIKTIVADSISQLVIYPGDTTICLGTSVQYNVSGVFDNITWTPDDWIDNPNSATVTVTPLANIGYIISATNGVCVAASDTFVIRTIQPIPIEVTATPDQVVLGLNSTITSQIGGQIDSIIWTPDATLDCRECPNPIALPTQTTTYYATIYYSENGTTCSSVDSVTITVLKVCDNSIIYVPNTFTPNGDGLNDVFMIRGLAATRINHFRIFDRWGKLLFETLNGIPNDPQWAWQGTDRNGEKLNSAVYVYTYEIECINGDIVTGQGNVTLIR